MRLTFPESEEIEEIELRDVMQESLPSGGDDCFKMNAEMKFADPKFHEHSYCEEIKRGTAFNWDDATYVRASAFGWTE